MPGDQSDIEQSLFDQFSRKKADLRCRVCGHADFMLLWPRQADLGTYVHLESPRGADQAPQSPRLRTVSIACSNCGHIEQFLIDPLMDRKLGDTE